MSERKATEQLQSMRIDKESFHSKNPFDVFQEIAFNFPTRCSFEYSLDEPFHTSWTHFHTERASAFRWKSAAHTTRRTENDIADSAPAGHAILYVIDGGARVTQNGEEVQLRPGDAARYDLDRPMEVMLNPAGLQDCLLITLPRQTTEAAAGGDGESPLRMVDRHAPLFQCSDYLADALGLGRQDELSHVVDACGALLGVELLLSQRSDESDASAVSAANYLLRDILSRIERELHNPLLSPQWLAEQFCISQRYVHKLFSNVGITCQAYILGERLERARHDLATYPAKINIATLSYRWCFSDPSSFGRAFKKKFGCSPSEYRNICRG